MKDLLNRLIEIRRDKLSLEEEEKAIMAELLDSEFEYEKIEGVEVRKKQRSTISLSPTADMKTIKLRYPDLCKTVYGVDAKKLTNTQLEYIKLKFKEAYYEDIQVDAKQLNEITKEFTQQKVTTYIEVKGA